ncbi:SRPBCC family protein [Pseudoroseicyclus sp. H15]
MRKDNPSNALRMTRLFEAPAASVYALFTRAELLREWFGAGFGRAAADCRIDLRCGGRWQLLVDGPDGRELVSGVYHEILPRQRVTFSIDKPQAGSVVTVELHETDETCELRLLQTGFPDLPSIDAQAFAWVHAFRTMEEVTAHTGGRGPNWEGPPDMPLMALAAELRSTRQRLEDEITAVNRPLHIAPPPKLLEAAVSSAAGS